jgi:hypothetical protein
MTHRGVLAAMESELGGQPDELSPVDIFAPSLGNRHPVNTTTLIAVNVFNALHVFLVFLVFNDFNVFNGFNVIIRCNGIAT